MHKALKLSEKEPVSGGRVMDQTSSGRKSLRSGGVRVWEYHIRFCQGGRPLYQVLSERSSGAPDAVRTEGGK